VVTRAVDALRRHPIRVVVVVVAIVLVAWFAGMGRSGPETTAPSTVTVYMCLGAKPGDAILKTYEMTSPCPSGFLETGREERPASAAPSGQ